MLNVLDNYLNRITSYKLVLWCLRFLAALAFVFSFIGTLGLPLKGLVISLVVLMAVCSITHKLLARVLRVPTNTESYAITLLILFLILPPATTWTKAGLLALAGVLAIASKFLITWNAKHIFNPAAFGAAVLSMLGLLGTTWWVGNSVMWPAVLVVGLLVVRKIRRFSLFATFAVVSLVLTAVTTAQQGQDIAGAIRLAITSSPLLFLGTIMLTEPATMPSRRLRQVVFGVLVGTLYALYIRIGPLQIYPEVALLIGNLFAFAVNPRYRLFLTLKEVQKFSDRVYNFVFTPNRKPEYLPGQYLEWTLPHSHEDSRGNRRTFSLASSPTEADVMLGVKFYKPSSSFKKALMGLKPEAVVVAGQIAGDFTLPADKAGKLAFIAGGIGITPFRSMLKYLIDTHDRRDIILIYAVTDPVEVAYGDVLVAAEAQGVQVIRLLTTVDTAPEGWQGKAGKLTPEFIAEHVPDHADRTFYLSGPQPMIEALSLGVRKLGARKIKTDYFSGY